MRLIACLVVLAATLLAGIPAQAQQPIPPDLHKLFEDQWKAAAAQDSDAMDRLVHGGWQQCFEGDAAPVLDQVRALEAFTSGSSDATMTLVPAPPGAVADEQGRFVFSVRPTHRMDLSLSQRDATDDQRMTFSFYRWLHRDEAGNWTFVRVCPTEAGVELAKQALGADPREGKFRTTVEGLDPVYRAEIEGLIARGANFQAGEEISGLTGADVDTAMGAVRMIAKQAGIEDSFAKGDTFGTGDPEVDRIAQALARAINAKDTAALTALAGPQASCPNGGWDGPAGKRLAERLLSGWVSPEAKFRYLALSEAGPLPFANLAGGALTYPSAPEGVLELRWSTGVYPYFWAEQRRVALGRGADGQLAVQWPCLADGGEAALAAEDQRQAGQAAAARALLDGLAAEQKASAETKIREGHALAAADLMAGSAGADKQTAILAARLMRDAMAETDLGDLKPSLADWDRDVKRRRILSQPAFKAFADAFRVAFNARDIQALDGMTAKASLDCLDASNRDVVEAYRRRDMVFTIADDARVGLQAILPDGDPGQGDVTDYPVVPEGVMTFQVDPTPWGFVIIDRGVIQEDGQWRLLRRCPDSKRAAVLRQRLTELQRDEDAARKALRNQPLAVRQAVEALLDQQKRTEAEALLAQKANLSDQLARVALDLITENRIVPQSADGAPTPLLRADEPTSEPAPDPATPPTDMGGNLEMPRGVIPPPGLMADALQGDTIAMAELGRILLEGDAGGVDPAAAYIWYGLAARLESDKGLRDAAALGRAKAAEPMDPALRTQAFRRMRELEKSLRSR